MVVTPPRIEGRWGQVTSQDREYAKKLLRGRRGQKCPACTAGEHNGVAVTVTEHKPHEQAQGGGVK